MPTTAATRYCAWAAHDGRGHGHEVEATSFTDAAAQFVEVWHPAADDDHAVRIVVRDQASGEEQCFVVDLAAGELDACE